jgi:hypothetical protein
MAAAKRQKKEIIQLIGHTPQNFTDIKGKSNGGGYNFVDTLTPSGEYFIIEDGKTRLGTLNKI